LSASVVADKILIERPRGTTALESVCGEFPNILSNTAHHSEKRVAPMRAGCTGSQSLEIIVSAA
jgi:hypothetical protein